MLLQIYAQQHLLTNTKEVKILKNDDFKNLIEEARSADLLNYFQSSGYSVERKGNQFYVKEFPGLCIKPETNSWYSHYDGIGRTNNSLDCLILVT